MADMISVRIPPDEKHALRVLAAESNLTISEFVLKTLRENVALKDRAILLAEINSQVEDKFHIRKNDEAYAAR